MSWRASPEPLSPSAQLRRESLAAVVGQCAQNLKLDLIRAELAKVLLVALLEGCLEGRQVLGVGVPSAVASFAGVVLCWTGVSSSHLQAVVDEHLREFGMYPGP
jgi:hypothetical protein